MSTAIGDIAGSAYEGRSHRIKDYESVELFSPRARFTDDTVCTFACAEAFIDGLDMAKNLWDRCNNHPHAGYGHKFRAWLANPTPQPYLSLGNGSAMRCSAAGWLSKTEEQCIEMATLTANPTHNHPEGLKGAECIATLTYWLRTCRITKDDVEAKTWKMWGYEIPTIREINKIGSENHFDGTCMETVPMAIRCFLESQNFEEAIRYAVMADGDTDTKAAITGTLAEAFYETPMELISKALSYLPDDMLAIVNQYLGCLSDKV